MLKQENDDLGNKFMQITKTDFLFAFFRFEERENHTP